MIGLELNRLSAPQIAVINSSSVTSTFPRMLFRARFALLIIDSKTPPKWSATGGVKLPLYWTLFAGFSCNVVVIEVTYQLS